MNICADHLPDGKRVKVNKSPDTTREETFIAAGYFGLIYRAQLKGETVVIKRAIRAEGVGVRALENECRILAKLNHENIVQLYFTTDEPSIVMEYAENGSLSNVIVSKELFKRPVIERINHILQIFRALQHLHSKKIAHRDINAQNILVTKNWTMKLADFGLSIDGENFFDFRKKDICSACQVSKRFFDENEMQVRRTIFQGLDFDCESPLIITVCIEQIEKLLKNY